MLGEQTVKCGICGDPYVFYSHSAADQSACFNCRFEAREGYRRRTPYTETEIQRKIVQGMIDEAVEKAVRRVLEKMDVSQRRDPVWREMGDGPPDMDPGLPRWSVSKSHLEAERDPNEE